MTELRTYLLAEHGRMAKVAGRAGLAPAYLSQIANGRRPIPAQHAAALERECEFHVRRWAMFPDSWHRIWPELVGTEGAPPIPTDEARDAA